MGNINVKIVNFDENVSVESGISLFELSEKFKHKFEYPILLAAVDNEATELRGKLTKDCSVNFIDFSQPYGYSAYQRGVVFLLIYAVKKLFGGKAKVNIKHSINKNYYCIVPDIDIDEEFLRKTEDVMHDLAEQNLPIEKLSVSVQDGVDLYEKYTDINMKDELRYIRSTNITVHKLNDFYNYMYGPMVISTGYLKSFALKAKDEGFILQFASIKNPSELNEMKNYEKLANIFKESSEWAKVLNVTTAKALNDTICNKTIKDIVCISEAFHEKKLAQIADMITNGRKNIVLIAGPSSSGKTTFAERLCIQLRVNKLKPYIISLDDYYLDKKMAPLDEFGKPDFECIESIDVKQFNDDINALLRGERVQIPRFNFFKGCREYTGNFIKLNSNEVLVIEGIHGLNEKLTETVPKENKFKIYISALTQLNINPHNRITTTDTRLIRRMVRDSQFRGFDAVDTIDIWPSVLRGEQKNIFPYQEEADIMFNSALVYELAALKPIAEPLLFNIDKSQPQYIEAKRLIKFLNSFLSMNYDDIPKNSIIREFIGGSCFA